MLKRERSFRSGELFVRKIFTLMELLIVVAIIAILASMLLPALGKVREKAMQVSCAGKMKQIGAAIHAYCIDSDTIMPCYTYSKDLDMFGLLYPYCPGPYVEGSKLKNSTTGDYAYFSAFGENRYLWKASSIPVCPMAAITIHPNYTGTVSPRFRPTYVPSSCAHSGSSNHKEYTWLQDESLGPKNLYKRRLEQIKGRILLGEQIYLASDTQSSTAFTYLKNKGYIPCWASAVNDTTRDYLGGIVHGGLTKGNWLYKDGHVEMRVYYPMLVKDSNNNYFMGR